MRKPPENAVESGSNRISRNRGQGKPRIDPPLLSSFEKGSQNSTMSLEVFVAQKFIPEHVEHKSIAGRTHYKAILKHVLRPEKVDRLFCHKKERPRARLKASPDWPYLDEVRLCDIRPAHVQQLTSFASDHGYSTQTVKHIRNVISAIISHAKREQCFSGENPASGVELPPMARCRAENLTIVQAKRMLRLMQYPEREIALITITTGMSISEICGLQWKNVNLMDSKIDIEGEPIAPRSIFVKNQYSSRGLVGVNIHRIRTVEIPEPLFRTLQSLGQMQNTPDPNRLVLPSLAGTPINPGSLRMQRLRPIGRKLNMPGLSWQILTRAHYALLSELRTQFYEDLTG
jgi:integrase